MSPTVKTLALTALAAALMLAGASALRQKADIPRPDAETAPGKGPENVAFEKIAVPRSPAPVRSPRTAPPANSRPVTPGLIDISGETAQPAIQASGYVIDKFADWQSIPEGYTADGIVARGGALMLDGDAASTAPRTGTLQSPPLPLLQPAMAAPVDVRPAPLPDGAMVQVQISVSPDGQEWSPWQQVRQYYPPDGKRVSPPVQPSLAKADLQGPDLQSSQTLSGPAIRYRLALSASGTVSPEVTDVRVWKRESFY